MAKKRPTLDAFLNNQSKVEEQKIIKAVEKRFFFDSEICIEKVRENASDASEVLQKPEVVRHMLYLPIPVYD